MSGWDGSCSKSWLIGLAVAVATISAGCGSASQSSGEGGGSAREGGKGGRQISGAAGASAAGGSAGVPSAGQMGGVGGRGGLTAIGGAAGTGTTTGVGGVAGTGGVAGAGAGPGGMSGVAGSPGPALTSFCPAGFANCDRQSPDCETAIDAVGACSPHYLGTYAPVTGYGTASSTLGPDGSRYLAGSFARMTDFDPGPGMDLRAPRGQYDVYLVRFNADGSYAWTRTWGSPLGSMRPFRVSAAGAAVVLTGYFQGMLDLDPGAGTMLGSSVGGGTFVVSLTTGGDLRWAGALQTGSSCYAEGLAIDGAGDVYLAGNYSGICDLDPGPAVEATPSSGIFFAGFLVKLAGEDGSHLWSMTLDKTVKPNIARAVTVSPTGDIWVAGDRDRSPVITSFTPAGVVRFETMLPIGPNGGASARAISSAADGSVYIGGDGAGTIDFDPGTAAVWRDLPSTEKDIASTFVLKLAADGSLLWVSILPSAGFLDLTAFGDGGVLVAARARQPSTTTDVAGTFLAALASDASPAWSFFSGGPYSVANGIATSGSTFVVAGGTDDAGTTGDFNPSLGVDPAPPGVTYLSRFSD